MQRYWHILWAACGILAITLIFVLVSIFQGDKITYTDVAVETKTTPTVTDADPVKGDVTNPLVTVVEYCQFSSLGCKTIASELNEVLKSFPEGVQIVWKDFPNTSLAPESAPAAVAARCAQDQGKFWEYHDALFSHQTSLSSDTYPSLAKELGLKEKAFSKCLENQLGVPLIQIDTQEAITLQIAATPTLYINNARIGGTIKTADLISKVQQALTVK